MARGRAVLAVFAALALSSAAGCSGGDGEPTLEEAGAALVEAGTVALRDPARSAGYEITDPGTDFSQCRPGRALRTFAGTGTMEPGGSDLDGFLDANQAEIGGALIQSGLGFQSTVAERDFNDDLKYRVEVFTKRAGDIRLRVEIRPTGYEVTGSTGCLGAG